MGARPDAAVELGQGLLELLQLFLAAQAPSEARQVEVNGPLEVALGVLGRGTAVDQQGVGGGISRDNHPFRLYRAHPLFMLIKMNLRVDVFSGSELAPFIPELARLRMAVFREWPYLYEGSLEYETHYLAKFLNLPESTLVVVRDGERVVGASTALPLAQAEAEFQEPFIQAGLDPQDWYYFGESVLEPAYRGRGLGVAFFSTGRPGPSSSATAGPPSAPSSAPPSTPSSRPITCRWMPSGSGGGSPSAPIWSASSPGATSASPRKPPSPWSSG